MFSSYKQTQTMKVLIGVTPGGAAAFVSDAYEGSISDKEITKKCGFLDYLITGDGVLAGIETFMIFVMTFLICFHFRSWIHN